MSKIHSYNIQYKCTDMVEDVGLFEDLSDEVYHEIAMSAPPDAASTSPAFMSPVATADATLISPTATPNAAFTSPALTTPVATVDVTITPTTMTPATGSTQRITTDSSVPMDVGYQSPDVPVCEKFTEDTCGCTKADGKPCSTLFSLEHYIELRAQASFLTHDELDLVLMGSIMSTIMTDDIAWRRHKPAKRSRIRQHYMHNGHTVCKTTFMFMHGVGKKRLMAVKDQYQKNGLETRIHKNNKRLPHNYRSLEVIKNVTGFLQNYAEENAILLPGRIPGYKRDDIKILPSSQSKKVAMC